MTTPSKSCMKKVSKNVKTASNVLVLSRLSRGDLEDQCYKTKEDLMELKKELNDERNKYNVLNTRFIRLKERKGNRELYSENMEKMIASQADQIKNLETVNDRLIGKMRVMRNRSFQAKDRASIRFSSTNSTQTLNNDSQIDLDHRLSDLESAIEILRTENVQLKTELDCKRKSAEKSNREVQTVVECQCEVLIQNLEAERVKVFELENNLKLMKVSDEAIKEANHRLNNLEVIHGNGADEFVSSIRVLEDENEELKNRLTTSIASLDTYKKLNRELTAKVVSIQNEADTLRLSLNRKNAAADENGSEAVGDRSNEVTLPRADKSFDDATYDVSADNSVGLIESDGDNSMSEGEIKEPIAAESRTHTPTNILRPDNVDHLISAEECIQKLKTLIKNCEALMRSKRNTNDTICGSNDVKGELVIYIKNAVFSDDFDEVSGTHPIFLTWEFNNENIACMPMLSDKRTFKFSHNVTFEFKMNDVMMDYFTRETLNFDVYKRNSSSAEIIARCELMLNTLLLNLNRKRALELDIVKLSNGEVCGHLTVHCWLNCD